MLHLQFIFSFFHKVEPVSFHILKALLLATRPGDLDGFCALHLAQTKICPQITLRKITAAAGNLPNLRCCSADDAYAGPGRIPIAFRSNQFEVQKIVSVAAAVVQKKRGIAAIRYQYIYESIVVEIGEGYSAACVRDLEPVAAGRAHLNKLLWA